ncbi:MAG TPA: hypothetical protein VG944_19120 [Fimbriimonas sp.]|nr:hypothetical protein [Fimbriimonas sp.]
MDAFKEKTVGWLLVSGVVVIVISLILMFMFAGAGVFHGTMTREPGTDRITDPGDLNLVPLTFLLFVAGLGLIAGGLYIGLKTHNTRFEGPSTVVQNARVIARYGYTQDWNILSEDWQFEEAENPTYYVRLETAPGVVNEYECRPETYFAAGEGMYGDATLQGKWLGLFKPYIGVPRQPGQEA